MATAKRRQGASRGRRPGSASRGSGSATFGITPMLAKLGELPGGDQWAYEVKWDGIRVLARVDEADVSLWTRNGNDVTARYPRLVRELAEVGRGVARPLLLDGEIIAFDERGVPSFGRLQQRMNLQSNTAIEAADESVPAQLAAFDLVVVGGEPITGRDYEKRRELLGEIEFGGELVSVPRSYDDGEALLDQMVASGMEGVVAKKRTSLYESGRRSGSWIKIKRKPRQEFVIGGWQEGAGARSSTFGSLLLGVRSEHAAGKLRFVGSVGSGFSDQLLGDLIDRLKASETGDSPFDAPTRQRNEHFVRPTLVAEVEYQEMTDDGRLRHATFKGLRDDKNPDDVVFEEVQR